jgi:predicted GNAT family acetyltransferase
VSAERAFANRPPRAQIPVMPLDPVDESSEESMPASDPPSWTAIAGIHVAAGAEVPTVADAENNAAAHRFELRLSEGTAELRYRMRGPTTIVLAHTEVPAGARGRGIASRLAHDALEYARQHQLRVIPTCPYVRAYIQRHPEFADLVVGKRV